MLVKWTQEREKTLKMKLQFSQQRKCNWPQMIPMNETFLRCNDAEIHSIALLLLLAIQKKVEKKIK